MTDEERAFLALVTIGFFSMDKNGKIWRHKKMTGGSRNGAPAYEKILAVPERAERSESKGYPTILFTVDGKRLKVFVHRVVWMISNQSDIPIGMEINHKNGDRGNPHPANLEVVTRSGNAIHAIHVLGRKEKDQNGEKNSSAKLNEGQVREIRRLADQRLMAQSKIAQIFGVSQVTVNEIYLRKTWKHLQSTGS